MSKPIELLISADAEITVIHSDALVDLYDEGEVHISRASHVEPTEDGQWTADMSPMQGPVLGPFRLRQQALDAEVEWLRKQLFN